MKLMTQPGVGPLAPVAKGAAAAAAAASLTETLLPANKLEGDAAALEHQISLLSARITSIANHLKVKKGGYAPLYRVEGRYRSFSLVYLLVCLASARHVPTS